LAWAARCAGLGDALKRYTDEQKRIAVVMVGDARIIVRVEVCILARSFVSAFLEHSDGDFDQMGLLLSSNDCILYNQQQSVCLRLCGADLDKVHRGAKCRFSFSISAIFTFR